MSNLENADPKVIKEWLEKLNPNIEKAFSRNKDPERLSSQILSVILKNRKLLQDVGSLGRAILSCAQFELELGSELQQCGFMSYWDKNDRKYKACFQIWTQGYIELVLRSKNVIALWGEVVRAGDDFDYGVGTSPYINHKPSVSGERGDITHAYAVAKLKDGTLKFVVLDKKYLDQVKSCSKGGDDVNHPWNNEFRQEMCKKTAIKNLCKTLQKVVDDSAILAKALSLDEGNIEFEKPQYKKTKSKEANSLESLRETLIPKKAKKRLIKKSASNRPKNIKVKELRP